MVIPWIIWTWITWYKCKNLKTVASDLSQIWALSIYAFCQSVKCKMWQWVKLQLLFGLYSRCCMFLFSLNDISKGSFKVGLESIPWRWRWYVPMKDHCIWARLHVITSYKRVFFVGTIVRPSDLKSRCLNLIFVTEYIFV